MVAASRENCPRDEHCDRAGNVVDRQVEIAAVLVEQVADARLQARERRVCCSSGCSGRESSPTIALFSVRHPNFVGQRRSLGGSVSVGVGVLGWEPSVAAQLASTRRASADGEPGSAVYVDRVRPGSAGSSNAS